MVETRDSFSIRVHTPDGTMFIHVIEHKDEPRQVLVNIGKSGHSLQAWADALARVISMALRVGVPLHHIVAELSQITTERTVKHGGVSVKSGPDGLANALWKYVAHKGGEQSDERPARLGT